MSCSVLEDIQLQYEICKSVSRCIQYHIMWFNQSSIEGVRLRTHLFVSSLSEFVEALPAHSYLGLDPCQFSKFVRVWPTDTKRTLVWHTNVKLRTVKFCLTTLIVWSNDA